MKQFQVPYELTGYVVVDAADSREAASIGRATVERLTKKLSDEGEIFGRVPSRGGVTKFIAAKAV